MPYLLYITGKIEDTPYWGEDTPLKAVPQQPGEVTHFFTAERAIPLTDSSCKVRATHWHMRYSDPSSMMCGFNWRAEAVTYAYGGRWTSLCEVRRLRRLAAATPPVLARRDEFSYWDWRLTPTGRRGPMEPYRLYDVHMQLLDEYQHFMAFLDTAIQWGSPVYTHTY